MIAVSEYEASIRSIKYNMVYYEDYDFTILNKIRYHFKPGKMHDISFNDCFVMADTETSKAHKNVIGEDGKPIPVINYVVAWTISVRAAHHNIVTLWGRSPDQMALCIRKICDNMRGKETYIYFHNLSYDWEFIRKFMLQEFGSPRRQLNTKPHYPIYIQWDHFILKDSLILAQRSLEKWANDMDVKHKKATGKWDYDKIRGQQEHFSPEELEYIEHDTLAGVEALDRHCIIHHKTPSSIHMTATGIPREQVIKRGKKNRAKEKFLNLASDFKDHLNLEQCFHGGYTHGNRHYVNFTLDQTILHEFGYEKVQAADFASSYPYIMLSEKFPMEKFTAYKDCTMSEVLESKNYAYYGKLCLVKPRLKDDSQPMPYLQYSKAVKIINPVLDNGRVLCAAYMEIWVTDPDIEIINSMYDSDYHVLTNVMISYKSYLPRWLTDYVFECFRNKSELKGKDPVLYAISKATINSIYGMMVQRVFTADITEDYVTGEWKTEDVCTKEKYEEYLDNKRKILPYQWGVWITSYACRNLFLLGKCFDVWLYSDTDSCYGLGMDPEQLQSYNEGCKQKLKDNGYGSVYANGREYWLGIAEHGPDDVYSEFKYMGAKRYCGRGSDGKLHITVAGVPKKGVECLKDDINNFKEGFIFPGEETGKLLHTYIPAEDIYKRNGIIYADSVDLTPCPYELSSIKLLNWQQIWTEEIEVVDYEDF